MRWGSIRLGVKRAIDRWKCRRKARERRKAVIAAMEQVMKEDAVIQSRKGEGK